jgi:membrane fusion protein (multidrug efflux system)
MKQSNKIKTIVILILIIIFGIIAARHFVGLHFKKKFSVRPAPGVIISKVDETIFFKSIETFGTAIARNSKTYRVKENDIVGNFNIDERFVKKGDIIVALKDNQNIIAEFAGKLGKREIAQGVLGSDSLIITLDDIKNIFIDIKIPENYVGVIKKGLKAEISSSAFKINFKGKIESLSSRIDPSTRSILARVIVKNDNFQIIPGQLMTVKIIYDEEKELGVPESAVTIQGDTSFVYIVEDNIAKKRNIEIGKRNFGKVSVLSGLEKNEEVVIEGISKVRNNIKVKILKSKN